MRSNPNKSLMFLFVAALALIFISAYAVKEHSRGSKFLATPPNSLSAPPSDMVSVYICDNVISAIDAVANIQNFYSRVLNASSQSFEAPAAKLPQALLVKTQDTIVARHQRLTGHGDCKMYFPCLEIFFGLDGNVMKQYYKFVTECCTTYTMNAKADFTVTEISPDYYSYNGTDLAPDMGAGNSISSYSNTVLFKEPGAAATRTFVARNDQNGDSRAVIVPFQIMNTVLDRNASDELTILNIAITTTYANKVRQSLMVGPKMAVNFKGKAHFPGNVKAKDVKLFAGSYVGNFADRSHLCPPSCIDAAFTTTTNPVCP